MNDFEDRKIREKEMELYCRSFSLHVYIFYTDHYADDGDLFVSGKLRQVAAKNEER